MATRSYKDAIEHLNSLQSNAATLEAVRASGGRLTQFAIPEMLEYLGRIGYSPDDLNALNVLHVTGTKGKGSTCAFIDSILRRSKPEWKVGLYTSPHLVAVRERIRINGAPLPEADFARFFFEVWDRLERNDVRQDPGTPPKPMYFRFLTLVAFHAFLSLKVDATVLEVGVGGTYDCTNIVPQPVVTGVTALGLDHTAVLGKTLREIAWQKGGIFKKNVPALTVEQPDEGMEMLKQQAETHKASEFAVVSALPALSQIRLGIAGKHQVQNATLGVHMARHFISTRDQVQLDELPQSFIDGLERTTWPGRCQAVVDPKHPSNTWYLDGAHTIESLDCCVQWFVTPGVGIEDNSSSDETVRVLIFNCTNGRSGESFLGSMLDRAKKQLDLYGQPLEAASLFRHVIFCSNVTYADGGFKGDLTTHAIPEADLAELRTQQQLANAWSTLNPTFPTKSIHVLPSIEHAVNIVRSIQSDKSPVKVLVSGSLHLVGGTIEVAGLTDVAL